MRTGKRIVSVGYGIKVIRSASAIGLQSTVLINVAKASICAHGFRQHTHIVPRKVSSWSGDRLSTHAWLRVIIRLCIQRAGKNPLIS